MAGTLYSCLFLVFLCSIKGKFSTKKTLPVNHFYRPFRFALNAALCKNAQYLAFLVFCQLQKSFFLTSPSQFRGDLSNATW